MAGYLIHKVLYTLKYGYEELFLLPCVQNFLEVVGACR